MGGGGGGVREWGRLNGDGDFFFWGGGGGAEWQSVSILTGNFS